MTIAIAIENITFRAEDSLIFFARFGMKERRNFIWLAYIIMCKKH